MLHKLTEVPANERMRAVSEHWARCSDAEKKQYNKRKDKMMKQYQKELEKFKKVLFNLCKLLAYLEHVCKWVEIFV